MLFLQRRLALVLLIFACSCGSVADQLHRRAVWAVAPLWALEEWRTAAHIDSGPLFRVMNRHGRVLAKRLSAEAVALVVKRYVEKLNYDPADFAGHSLRAGLATSAAAAGKSERAIMNQTGHRSLTTVRRYIRDGNLFRENAADKIGL